MKKARSRLSILLEQKIKTKKNPVISNDHQSVKKHLYRSKTHPLASHYLAYSSTLILAIPFYLATHYIFKNIPPDLIKNFILVNSYLPLQLALFFANFFFFSFLTLKTRRGLLIAAIITIFLFLKLQQVIISWQIVISILCFFVIIELISSGIEKQQQKNK
jgi:hypothetical protein